MKAFKKIKLDNNIYITLEDSLLTEIFERTSLIKPLSSFSLNKFNYTFIDIDDFYDFILVIEDYDDEILSKKELQHLLLIIKMVEHYKYKEFILL